MYLIEALKEVKSLREKVHDLTRKISNNSAHREDCPTEYKDPAAEVKSWQDQVHGATKRIEELLLRINKTNLATSVSIKIGDNTVEKSIAGWILRTRELASLDCAAWIACTNRMLRAVPDRKDDQKVYTPILNYDAKLRDRKVEEYQGEPGIINTRLETVNATTELLEL